MNPYYYPRPAPRPPYLLGLLCLIPLVGAFVGAGLILVSIITYKDKWLALIGIGGILFSVLIYGGLFWAGTHAKVFKQGFAQLSQMELNRLLKDVEFYKLEHGEYPESLAALKEDDSLVTANDPVHFTRLAEFRYERIGDKYKVFSAGDDGVDGTTDDIYPSLPIRDSSRIGLLRPAGYRAVRFGSSE
ncbi:type II secretion system protein GspG [Flaviaesturariibacter terrae]